MPLQKVNLAEKLQMFSEHWNPKIVGELNGQHVKLVKLKGEFVWHHHDSEDELLLVLKGTLTTFQCLSCQGWSSHADCYHNLTEREVEESVEIAVQA